MNQSISIDEVVMKINSHRHRTLAENFIDDVVRPNNLSDIQAVALFEQVKQSMQRPSSRANTRCKALSESWGLLPC